MQPRSPHQQTRSMSSRGKAICQRKTSTESSYHIHVEHQKLRERDQKILSIVVQHAPKEARLLQGTPRESCNSQTCMSGYHSQHRPLQAKHGRRQPEHPLHRQHPVTMSLRDFVSRFQQVDPLPVIQKPKNCVQPRAGKCLNPSFHQIA